MTFDTKFMELIGVFLAVSITSIILSLPHFYHYRHNIFELNHSCLQYVKDDLFLQVFVEQQNWEASIWLIIKSL